MLPINAKNKTARQLYVCQCALADCIPVRTFFILIYFARNYSTDTSTTGRLVLSRINSTLPSMRAAILTVRSKIPSRHHICNPLKNHGQDIKRRPDNQHSCQDITDAFQQHLHHIVNSSSQIIDKAQHPAHAFHPTPLFFITSYHYN